MKRTLLEETDRPVGAKILRAGFCPADQRPSIWVTVPTPDKTEGTSLFRKFLIAPTGATVPDEATYLGTDTTGALVWHFFEVTCG